MSYAIVGPLVIGKPSDIRPGTMIFCEAGHHRGNVLRRPDIHEINTWIDAFEWIDGQRVQVGALYPVQCTHEGCGAVLIRHRTDPQAET